MKISIDDISDEQAYEIAVNHGIIDEGDSMGLLDKTRAVEILEWQGEFDQIDRHDRDWRAHSRGRSDESGDSSPIWDRREVLMSEVVPEFIESDSLMVRQDDPGVGKTTSVSIALGERDVRHVILFEKHEKAVDHMENEFTPNNYFHLKGAEQPLYSCCIGEGECLTHDDPPKMCPAYDREQDDIVREEFETLSSILGHQQAHDILNDVPNSCNWLDQFEELSERDYVVGVHEYQGLFADWENVVIDESPGVMDNKQEWTTSDLRSAATHIRGLVESPIHDDLADWVQRKLRNGVDDGSLDDVEPPNIDVTGDPTELLAELKALYNEEIVAEIEMGMWDGTPTCFDALLGALAEVGWERAACRCVIASGPETLFHCPHCMSPVTNETCVSCHWERGTFDIIDRNELAYQRCISYVDNDKLNYIGIPDAAHLPDSPLILDATATMGIISSMYGVDREDIVVGGTEPMPMNATVTQITNGQYHASIIKESAKDGGTLAERIQRAIDMASREHRKALYVIKSQLEGYFDWPDNSAVRKAGNVRGLDFMDFDAVMIIGALHPDMEGVERRARLLSMDNEGIEVGGSETTEVREIVENGRFGESYHEVETKAYTGLVGEIFKDTREAEIVQAAHRPRPVIPDQEEKHIYLVTNVPTEIPVDELVSWKGFLNESVSFRAIDQLYGPIIEEFDEDPILTTGELVEMSDSSRSSVGRWVRKAVKVGAAAQISTKGNEPNRYRFELAKLREIAR